MWFNEKTAGIPCTFPFFPRVVEQFNLWVPTAFLFTVMPIYVHQWPSRIKNIYRWCILFWVSPSISSPWPRSSYPFICYFTFFQSNIFFTRKSNPGFNLFSYVNPLTCSGLGGFGTYECVWTLAFMALGLPKEVAIASGFGVHIILILYFP